MFCDQLGCGRSDRPQDAGLYRFETFLRELDVQRAEARRTAERHTEAGTVTDPEFRSIVDEFFRRHMTNGRPWPDSLTRAFDGMGSPAYTAMWEPAASSAPPARWRRGT